ncbi:MAG: hypothetical protein MR435_07570 [Coprococcus catus]|nr:hypothetical protein [Coprococcus catus]
MYEYEYNRRDKPKCCKDCENYQPRWKYRFCFFVRCPYKLKDTTFRRTPLKKEYFPQKEVVRMSDV